MAGQQRLRHRIVQQALDRGRPGIAPAGEIQPHAALDTVHRQAGTAQQLGSLARPGRDGAQPRGDEARNRALGQRFDTIACLQDALQGRRIRDRAGLGIDPVDMPRAQQAQVRGNGEQAGLEALQSER